MNRSNHDDEPLISVRIKHEELVTASRTVQMSHAEFEALRNFGKAGNVMSEERQLFVVDAMSRYLGSGWNRTGNDTTVTRVTVDVTLTTNE